MGASTSRESTSAPRRESEAKTSGGDVEDECAQLRREFFALEGKRAELGSLQYELRDRKRKLKLLRTAKKKRKVERRHNLEEQERELEQQLAPLRRELKQMQKNLLPKRKRLKDLCKARKIKSTRRLELPPELWEKILGNLDENDLFPLALSCRYFRQKQMELVARTRKRMRQSGPGSRKRRLTLRTNLRKMFENDEPASAEYLQFCSKEKVLRKERKRKRDSLEEIAWKRDWHISILAAFHGHLPLLQELLQSSENLPFCDLTTDDYSELAGHAGESSSSSSSSFFRLLTSFSSSQRAAVNWRPCSG